MQLIKKILARLKRSEEIEEPAASRLQSELIAFAEKHVPASPQDREALEATLSEVSRMMSMEGSIPLKVMEQKNWTASDTLLTAMGGICIEILMSGNVHSEAGVLSKLGDAYLRLFDLCTGELTRSGRLTVIQCMREADELQMIIANTAAVRE